MLRVVVGKDQVELYRLGLMYEISDSSQYKTLVKKFDFTNPTLTEDERKERIQQANTYWKENLR